MQNVFVKNRFKVLVAFAILTVFSVSQKNAYARASNDRAASGRAETRTVVDHADITVEIPAKIDRIVIASLLPLPSVYCLYAGSAEKLVGIPASSMAAAQNSFLIRAYPEIANADTSFAKGGQVNIEQLMSLKPDVVFYNARSSAERELFQSAGIPAVGFSTSRAGFNTIETYAQWIELLSQVIGETNRSKELIEFGRKMEADVKARVANIPESEKPKAMILYAYDNGEITTYGQRMFPQYWISTAGGINAAEELTGLVQLNMEQIYAWNPDIVILTNFNTKLPEDFDDGFVDGDDWRSVSAVQKKQVYKFPLGMYRWCPPSSDSPLSLAFLATKIQPELFKDFDLDAIISKYYHDYYNIDLTAEDLQKMYHPSRDAAGL